MTRDLVWTPGAPLHRLAARRRLTGLAGLAVLTGVIGCGPSAGEDGSSILVDYAQLSGGMVFATQAVIGANDYDLFWAPIPQLPTVSPQPLFPLTDANGDEWQPSVSPGGNGIAYARPDDGIFLIDTSGRITRITDAGNRFVDSLPAVSHDGAFVAWVREDTDREIGGTGFFETQVMIARSDGSNARAIQPKPGIVQDAPRFEPEAGSWRIAWSEFNPQTIGPGGTGPQVYGLWVHDFRDNVGQFVCRDPAQQVMGTIQRCFGQHLAWPRPEVLVVTQSFFEIYLDGRPPEQVFTNVLSSVEGQLGGPVFQFNLFGYTTFPMAASYSGDRMVFDGVVSSVEGNLTTLSFWVASVDGTAAWRLQLDGHLTDIDLASTNNYLFSVATPQLIP